MSKDIEQCNLLIARAKDDPTYDTRCIAGELVFYYPYDYGLMPGHIYSEVGVDEFKISGSCEFHFDEWTKDPTED